MWRIPTLTNTFITQNNLKTKQHVPLRMSTWSLLVRLNNTALCRTPVANHGKTRLNANFCVVFGSEDIMAERKTLSSYFYFALVQRIRCTHSLKLSLATAFQLHFNLNRPHYGFFVRATVFSFTPDKHGYFLRNELSACLARLGRLGVLRHRMQTTD